MLKMVNGKGKSRGNINVFCENKRKYGENVKPGACCIGSDGRGNH
jgi:hypothetical protein